MIVFIEGVLAAKSAQGAVVENGGLGYRILMPTPDIAALPPVGERVRIFTHVLVKDDLTTAYGFESAEKKELFIQLIGVSSVGPKVGMGILSHLSPAQLKEAIVAGDVAAISGAPGVGRKTAGRLVLELKEKLALDLGPAGPSDSPALAEARQALMQLGYEPLEVAEALRGVEAGRPVDWYLKAALKRLAKV
jgi:holliday junction DNA helicase RuvA